ncbi:MAG: hypothetical protein SFZ02_12405 [bacterium]|nr:hypothetical protein [bacterium]
MIPLSQQSYAELRANWDKFQDDDTLEAVLNEIETREVLSFDTYHWLAGTDNHPQSLIPC